MSPRGPIGLATSQLSIDDPGAAVAAATEIEELGYGTLWLPGSQGNNLALIETVVRGTRTIAVASGILSVDRVPAREVAASYAGLEATHPGRFVAGLGGAHGARPRTTINAYLDALDTVPPVVPAPARVLAALGPRMLALAGERAAGAYPYLITPDYTAAARAALGPDRNLTVLLSVVPEADPDRARELARAPLRFLSTVGGYASNFHRMGFSGDDVASLPDRLVDSVVAWGSPDRIVARINEYRDAGADQVALQIAQVPDGEPPRFWWRLFADALLR